MDRKFETFTISWLLADFMSNPYLCVFNGPGSRLLASPNKCPVLPGRNFSLEQTIKLAANEKVAAVMWGPYEIVKGGFDLGVSASDC